MQLEDFPRPQDDNRRGMQWSAAAIYPQQEAVDFWFDQLQAMRVRWVKLIDDGNGSSLAVCRRLVAAGMMPVVRLDRGEQQNACPLGAAELETVRRLAGEGVRYFETNNEPDLRLAWGGQQPANWLDLVVDHFIVDAEKILALGGLPGLPAMSMGSTADPLQKLVERGRGDLFTNGAWVAIHNYTVNRPLDYPFDPVNLSGEPIGEAEYAALGDWAWQGRPREVINGWRESGKQPQPALADAGPCFLAWRLADERAAAALGRPAPIIATEGGPVVGWQDDGRYPRVTPQAHAETVAALDAFLQGAGQVGGASCPSHYLALCYSLLANDRMGSGVPGWENHAWFTERWSSDLSVKDRLPAVDRLQAAPAPARDRQPAAAAETSADVSVANAAAAGILSTAVGAAVVAGEPLPAQAQETAAVGSGPGQAGRTLPPGPSHSALGGKVFDHSGRPAAGVEVTLVRDGQVLGRTTTAGDATFRFEDLPLGVYSLVLGNVTVAGLALDGAARRAIRLTQGMPGAVAAKVDGSVPGAKPGQVMTLRGGDGERQQTLGADGGFAFADLPAGRYTLALEGIGEVAVDADVPAGGLFKLIFPLRSRIEGQVRAAQPGSMAVLHAPAPWSWTRQSLLDPAGKFAFDRLPAGRYMLQAADQTFVGLELNGENSLALPPIELPADRSSLGGQLRDAAGQPVAGRPLVLRRAGLFVARTESAAGGAFNFVHLPAGQYAVEAEPGGELAADVTLDGTHPVQRDLTLPGGSTQASDQPAAAAAKAGLPAASAAPVAAAAPGEPGPSAAPGESEPVQPPAGQIEAPVPPEAAGAGASPAEPQTPTTPAQTVEAPLGLAEPAEAATPPEAELPTAPAPDQATAGFDAELPTLVGASAVPAGEPPTAPAPDQAAAQPDKEPPAPAEASLAPLGELPVALAPDQATAGFDAELPALAGASAVPEAELPIALAPDQITAGFDAEPPALGGASAGPEGEPPIALARDQDTAGFDAEPPATAEPSAVAEGEPPIALAPDQAAAPAAEEQTVATPEASAIAAAGAGPVGEAPEAAAAENGPEGAAVATGFEALAAAPAAVPSPAPRPGYVITHYLLFGPPAAGSGAVEEQRAETRLALALATEYLRRTGATGGFSLDEARQAAHVTIVGDQVPANAEDVLRTAGCTVQRMTGDGYALAQQFTRLLAAIGEG